MVRGLSCGLSDHMIVLEGTWCKGQDKSDLGRRVKEEKLRDSTAVVEQCESKLENRLRINEMEDRDVENEWKVYARIGG